MPLAALIIANEKTGDASLEGLSILGQPLVEYQCRLAAAAGATHITICADALPGQLVGVLDRLRSEGLVIAFARTASEAADTVHPEEAVLLFARGAVASAGLVTHFAKAERAIVLVVANDAHSERLELIDASHRWAGLARIDGALVRQTAGLLGDWSLAETLLRLAVQSGATRHGHDPQVDGAAGIAASPHDLRALALVQIDLTNTLSETGWLEKPLGWLGRAVGRSAGKLGVPSRLCALGVIGMLIAAILLAISGWTVASLAILVTALLPADVANRLLIAAQQTSRPFSHYVQWRERIGLIILLLAGWNVSGHASWGPLILALWISWTILTVRQRQATAESSAALIGLGIVAGWPTAGFALALLHLLVPTMRSDLLLPKRA